MGLLGNIFGTKTDLGAIIEKGAVILDVRSKGEFQRGHAKGAINIPLDQVRNRLETIRQYQQPVVTCCASGMRSGKAKSILANAGIEAYNGGPWQKVDRLIQK